MGPEFKSNYAMFIERCELKGDKEESTDINDLDVDNCKYAYIELYDGTE